MSGSLTGVAVLSMLADTLEYGELKFGVRLDGLGFAANSFSTKAGPAIGGLLVTMVYAIGKLDTSLVLGQDQSSSALMALRLSMFVIPNLIALVQVILSFMYPLSQEKMEEVNGELANRHSDPSYIPVSYTHLGQHRPLSESDCNGRRQYGNIDGVPFFCGGLERCGGL